MIAAKNCSAALSSGRRSPALSAAWSAKTARCAYLARAPAAIPALAHVQLPRRRHGSPAPPSALAVPLGFAEIAAAATAPGWDIACAVCAGTGALIWVSLFKRLAQTGFLEAKLSRKLVHSTAGPLFMLSWPLFSALPAARFVAAAVPLINGIRLFLVGSGLLRDPGLVQSTSRSGDRSELLGGPLVYVVVLVAATLVFWRDSPAGLVAISVMCGGDGLADIVGRRLGRSNPLPWNPQKSVAGCMGMIVGGFTMSMSFINLFHALGFFASYHPASLAPVVAVVCLVATLVESLPCGIDDNISVPAVATAVSLALLPLAAAATPTIAAAAAAGAAAGTAPAVAPTVGPSLVPLLSLAAAAR